MIIKEVKARKILDSREKPTIEVSVNGCSASAPSGKSTGKYETPPYHKSLEWNINFINKTPLNLEIKAFEDLTLLEGFIKSKARLKDIKQFGANALVALEIATLRALAKEKKKELWQVINPKAKKLPTPVGNAIGGGLHSSAPHHPIFQEFLLIPNEKSFAKNVKIMEKTYQEIGDSIGASSINDEGAWETPLSNEQVLDALAKFKKIRIGLDVAASSFFSKGKYKYHDRSLSKEAQIFYMQELIEKYHPLYIEDTLEETDFSGFAKIPPSNKTLIVGDDLTVSHLSRLKTALTKKSINAIIIKPNQNGSILEIAKLFDFCKKHRIKSVISHRSGETIDNWLADLAFAFQADFIKCGIATEFRGFKLKRLIEIENRVK